MRLAARMMWVVVASLAAAGCGGGGPNLANVNGTVTFNGKPLEGAEIVFLPDPSNADGLAGNDVTGPEGNYKAMTQGRAGLVPGKYKVIVKKTILDKSKLPEEYKDDPHMAALAGGASDPHRPGFRAANKAAAPTEIRGEFDREVPAAGTVHDFDVKGASPP